MARVCIESFKAQIQSCLQNEPRLPATCAHSFYRTERWHPLIDPNPPRSKNEQISRSRSSKNPVELAGALPDGQVIEVAERGHAEGVGRQDAKGLAVHHGKARSEGIRPLRPADEEGEQGGRPRDRLVLDGVGLQSLQQDLRQHAGDALSLEPPDHVLVEAILGQASQVQGDQEGQRERVMEEQMLLQEVPSARGAAEPGNWVETAHAEGVDQQVGGIVAHLAQGGMLEQHCRLVEVGGCNEAQDQDVLNDDDEPPEEEGFCARSLGRKAEPSQGPLPLLS